jgi:HD-like signal output (HDOD) protein
VLGADGIRSAALAQAVHDAFDFSRPFQVELWHHSIAVAIAAGLIGRATHHPKPDELYALGLVHALGKMVLLHNRGEAYAKLADLMQLENVPAREVEREAFGFTSGEVGLVVLALWGLPRAMQAAVLYGTRLDAPGLRRLGREAAVHATVLSAADAVAKKVVAVAAIPADADVNLAAHHAVKALNLAHEHIDDLCQDLRDNYQEQRGFL